ncbi:MAG: hypothetical protein J0626_05525, partial [Rhodospirillaceae bacterium]|nr:hypothetical protein [Rhodospirillaceae bacterium]
MDWQFWIDRGGTFTDIVAKTPDDRLRTLKLLAITRGFGDALRIAYQNRPRLFDRHIVLPELLYQHVIEIDERIGAHGELVQPLDALQARAGLQAAYDQGLRSLAIIFM